MRRGLGVGLGKGYKNLVPRDPFVHGLSAKGVKTVNIPRYISTQKTINAKPRKKVIGFPTVSILDEDSFNKLFARDYSEGEIGYATTKVYPDGTVNVFVKDSGDFDRNIDLLLHELHELDIFEDLVNDEGIDPNIADEMAHNKNPIKLSGVPDKYQINTMNAYGYKCPKCGAPMSNLTKKYMWDTIKTKSKSWVCPRCKTKLVRRLDAKNSNYDIQDWEKVYFSSLFKKNKENVKGEN